MMAKSKMPGMLLSDLLSGFTLHDPVPALQISDIASNSAKVTANAAFIALPGIKTNGIDYAIDAVKIGQKTKISVVRKEKRLDFEITPGSRE